MAGCRPLTVEEAKRAYEELRRTTYPARNSGLLLIGITTGFRISELLSLRHRDVIDKERRVVDRITVQKAAMKGKRAARTVPLIPSARQAVIDIIRENRSRGYWIDATYLFLGQGRNHPLDFDWCLRLLQKAFRMEGIYENAIGGLGTHTLRKTYAATIYDTMLERLYKGYYCDPIVETGHALGHKSIDSTMHYINFRNTNQIAAREVLERTFNFNTTT